MKKSKLRDAFCEYLATIGMLGGIMAYIEPSGILHGYYFPLLHSCIWHALLIFIGLYITAADQASHERRHYRYAIAVLGLVVATATLLNVLFRSKPGFNMCYISPFYNTPLAVFKEIDVLLQRVWGQYPGRILSISVYIAAIAVGGFVLSLLSSFVSTKLHGKDRSTAR